MTEGWHNDDYLILLDESESQEMESQYDFERFIPGHRLIGLLGWDEFLVSSKESSEVFRVPTVPLETKRKEKWIHLSEVQGLQSDERFTGKIKWYTKPLIFGGDPNSDENLTWVSHSDHAKLVRFWNKKYREIKNEN